MEERIISARIWYYSEAKALAPDQLRLLERARAAWADAYTPYSGFQVGAALLLPDERIVTGANQENASFPLCLCAERVALAAAASVYPGRPVLCMAIAGRNPRKAIDYPVTPCGACRQVICETESRQGRPISLLLAGERGPVYFVESAATLLPLAFSGDSL
jgi:cytidine deaminase